MVGDAATAACAHRNESGMSIKRFMTNPPFLDGCLSEEYARDDRSDTRFSCWVLAGSAHTHVGLLRSPAIAPAILPRNAHDARSPLDAGPRCQANTPAQPLRCKLLKPYPAAKSP